MTAEEKLQLAQTLTVFPETLPPFSCRCLPLRHPVDTSPPPCDVRMPCVASVICINPLLDWNNIYNEGSDAGKSWSAWRCLIAVVNQDKCSCCFSLYFTSACRLPLKLTGNGDLCQDGGNCVETITVAMEQLVSSVCSLELFRCFGVRRKQKAASQKLNEMNHRSSCVWINEHFAFLLFFSFEKKRRKNSPKFLPSLFEEFFFDTIWSEFERKKKVQLAW